MSQFFIAKDPKTQIISLRLLYFFLKTDFLALIVNNLSKNRSLSKICQKIGPKSPEFIEKLFNLKKPNDSEEYLSYSLNYLLLYSSDSAEQEIIIEACRTISEIFKVSSKILEQQSFEKLEKVLKFLEKFGEIILMSDRFENSHEKLLEQEAFYAIWSIGCVLLKKFLAKNRKLCTEIQIVSEKNEKIKQILESEASIAELVFKKK